MIESDRDALGNAIGLALEAGLTLLEEDSLIEDSGADFRVLEASDESGTRWIIRMPRRADVLERARLEAAVLALVADRLPVAVPEWRHFSDSLIAYPKLRGHPAARIDMDAGGYVWRFDSAEPPSLFLESLASALAALHAVPRTDATQAGVAAREIGAIRAGLPARIERVRPVIDVPAMVLDRWSRWITEDRFWPTHSVLVHGDLHPPHILVDEGGETLGLLDWTEAHLGDAATDFALLYATMGRGPLERLLEHYGAAGGTLRPGLLAHIVEMWAAYPVTVAEFALTTGEDGPRHLAQSLVDATAHSMADEAGSAH